MSNLPTFNTVSDSATSRRYPGYPLNSTLVSSYTPDTIRSIISHAASGQPYSTSVWIRINRVGIQVSAQDPQVARSRIPVFIPIGLVHDIYMLPNINNVICIVYDELQSNMKGVLLYVVNPTDAQLIRDDFRIVKQASNNQQTGQTAYSSPLENRLGQINDPHQPTTNRIYTPISSSKSPLSNDTNRNTVAVRQQSPRRILYVRDNETNRNTTPTLPQLSYTPSKGSHHSAKEDNDHRRQRSPKRNQTTQSPRKRSTDNAAKRLSKHRSRSPEKPVKPKIATSSSSHEISQEKAEQQKQQEQLLLQQQQQWLLQQQQMAAWQAAQQQQQQQQMPMLPIGIYNRYVPKTIPLPTGETLKTTLPASGTDGAAANGIAMAFIEPHQTANTQQVKQSPSRSPSNSPHRQPQQQQNRSSNAKITTTSTVVTQSTHHHHTHRRNPTDESADIAALTTRSRAKYPVSKDSKIIDNDDDTKLYLKMLVDEMQAMKIEMNKLRQSAATAPRGRSDSIQVDLKELRSHIDLIRARMAMTPKIPEK